jgi:hypothetical protein
MRLMTEAIKAYREKMWQEAAAAPPVIPIGTGEGRAVCTNCARLRQHAILWMPSGFWCERHYLTTPACDYCDEPVIERPFSTAVHVLSNYCRDHYQHVMYPPLTLEDVQKLDGLVNDQSYEARNPNYKTPRGIVEAPIAEKSAGPCYEFLPSGLNSKPIIVHRFSPNSRTCTCGKKRVMKVTVSDNFSWGYDYRRK